MLDFVFHHLATIGFVWLDRDVIVSIYSSYEAMFVFS